MEQQLNFIKTNSRRIVKTNNGFEAFNQVAIKPTSIVDEILNNSPVILDEVRKNHSTNNDNYILSNGWKLDKSSELSFYFPYQKVGISNISPNSHQQFLPTNGNPYPHLYNTYGGNFELYFPLYKTPNTDDEIFFRDILLNPSFNDFEEMVFVNTRLTQREDVSLQYLNWKSNLQIAPNYNTEMGKNQFKNLIDSTHLHEFEIKNFPIACEVIRINFEPTPYVLPHQNRFDRTSLIIDENNNYLVLGAESRVFEYCIYNGERKIWVTGQFSILSEEVNLDPIIKRSNGTLENVLNGINKNPCDITRYLPDIGVLLE